MKYIHLARGATLYHLIVEE